MNFAVAGHAPTQDRAIGLGFVVLFHVLLVWGLANGLARKAIELLPSPLETKIIDEIKPPKDEPPPPKPDFEPPPPPFVPPPDIVLSAEAPVAASTITTTTVKAPPAPPKKAVRIAPRIDLKGSPRACREPEYPSASERLGEAGTAAISLLIGADGSVQQAKIVTSSGFKRLDEATVKAFSRCKFLVGTTDGRPESSWFSMQYKWVVPK
ncbi:MAG TPA: energy transducer TonB [Vicinamibacterales bacterium]|nr:energy transducer TonB [Vicinamibacterales bacterium]